MYTQLRRYGTMNTYPCSYPFNIGLIQNGFVGLSNYNSLFQYPVYYNNSNGICTQNRDFRSNTVQVESEDSTTNDGLSSGNILPLDELHDERNANEEAEKTVLLDANTKKEDKLNLRKCNEN